MPNGLAFCYYEDIKIIDFLKANIKQIKISKGLSKIVTDSNVVSNFGKENATVDYIDNNIILELKIAELFTIAQNEDFELLVYNSSSLAKGLNLLFNEENALYFVPSTLCAYYLITNKEEVKFIFSSQDVEKIRLDNDWPNKGEAIDNALNDGRVEYIENFNLDFLPNAVNIQTTLFDDDL